MAFADHMQHMHNVIALQPTNDVTIKWPPDGFWFTRGRKTSARLGYTRLLMTESKLYIRGIALVVSALVVYDHSVPTIRHWNTIVI